MTSLDDKLTVSGQERPKGSRFKRYNIYPGVDRLVGTALSLKKIADRTGRFKDRRGIWDYLKRTGQLKIHQEENPLCREKISQIIGSIIYEINQISYIIRSVQILAYSKATEAEKKTYEHFQSRPRSLYSWKILEEAFTRCFAAQKNGKKLSLEQLTSGLEISSVGLSRVFHSVRVEPMYGGKRRVRHKETAEEKTYEFFMFYPYSYYHTFKSVLEVVTMYMDAKTKGEKLSMKELGGGVIKESVKSILKFFNWKPLYKSPERVTPEQKETLRRVFPLHVSTKDIAYFIGLTYQSIQKNFSRIGSRPFSESWVDYLGPVGTNRLASKIYSVDDQDVGFTVEEVAKYLDTSTRIVNYAHKNRQTIEPKIIDLLKEFYPGREINKPYLKPT